MQACVVCVVCSHHIPAIKKEKTLRSGSIKKKKNRKLTHDSISVLFISFHLNEGKCLLLKFLCKTMLFNCFKMLAHFSTYRFLYSIYSMPLQPSQFHIFPDANDFCFAKIHFESRQNRLKRANTFYMAVSVFVSVCLSAFVSKFTYRVGNVPARY